MSLRDKDAPVGTTVRLTCRVISKSRYTAKWFKNEELVRSGSRFDLRSEFASQTLVIKDCKVEDSGEYRCEVKNADGVADTSAILTIQGRYLVAQISFVNFSKHVAYYNLRNYFTYFL